MATSTPSLRQRQRDALADAFRAAGDQRGLAFELQIHRNLPPFAYDLCASQRPASDEAMSSASAALNCAGSSDGMLWPERGITKQPGGRHDALQEHAAVDARLVLVADDHQERHRKAPELVFHLPQRRALELQVEHGERVAERRNARPACGRIRRGRAGPCASAPGAWARRHIWRRRLRIGSSANILPVSAASAFMASRCLASGVEPQPQPAATTEMQRVGRIDADMQRGVGAHGVADDMGLVDLERVHQRDDVVAEDVLAVARAVFRHVGGRIAALAEGDAAVGARKVPHLRLPAAPVAGIFVHEDDRRAPRLPPRNKAGRRRAR